MTLQFLFTLWFSMATMASTTTLTVDIGPLKTVEGKMFLALYDSPAAFLDDEQAVRREIAEIDQPDFQFTFDNLPPGTYAVAVFQDVNNNGKLDTNAFGFPKEPYGFSNDARGTFGPPSFQQAAFPLLEGTKSIRIKLR